MVSVPGHSTLNSDATLSLQCSQMKGLCCLLLVSALTLVTGQAPGDEQELCTVSFPASNRNIVEDPPNGKILMDSSHYNRLLPPNSNPVWQAVDLDDNNPDGLQSSVSCSCINPSARHSCAFLVNYSHL